MKKIKRTTRTDLEWKLFDEPLHLDDAIAQVFSMAEDMCGSWDPKEIEQGQEWVKAVHKELSALLKSRR